MVQALRRAGCLAGVLAVLAAGAAQAQERLTLAVGQRGNWDTSVAELGQRGGIFARHGLALNILYTQGGGETLQTVISGAVDIGVAPAVMAVLGAYSRGAPIRIIGAQATGAADLFWYVRADSPIRSLADIGGRTIAYSTTGASTHEIVKAFASQYDVSARPTATGGPPSTLTQVMSRQIDVGWSAPPFGLAQLDRGEIRIVAGGNDATLFRGQTVRLLTANARTLAARRPAMMRFMRAYRETVAWMYADPDALRHYAEFANITEAMARRSRDDFFPSEALDPDRIVGLDLIMPTAVELRYMVEPLSEQQLAELIQIPPR